MRFVDAHIHLASYTSSAEVLEFAKKNNVALYSASTNLTEAVTNSRLAKENKGLVRSFSGVHPSNASLFSPVLARSQIWKQSDGIGEIGLDPKYSEVGPKSAQMTAFESQLQIAQRLSKPVQVHSRMAEKDCLETLGGYSLHTVLLHWFEGESMLKTAAERGYYVSVGPALLYSKKLESIVRKYDHEFVLAETDGPVVYSALGNQVGGVHLLATVVFKIAQLWRIGFEQAAMALEENATRYLSTKGA
jgi:TatD DNase family protein